MVTVACLFWGDWCAPHGETYVHRLKAAVERHLHTPHRFVCLSDREIEGVETRRLNPPSWKRNVPKMALYAPENGFQGRVLAMDLDDVPVGPLDAFLDYEGPFCCTEDPWQLGQAGGGLISFDADDPNVRAALYDPLLKDPDAVEKQSKGFERFWLRLQLGESIDFWPRDWVVDAKPRETLDIIESLPPGARVAHFHGEPRPHEVPHIPWVREHWA